MKSDAEVIAGIESRWLDPPEGRDYRCRRCDKDDPDFDEELDQGLCEECAKEDAEARKVDEACEGW